MSKCRISPKHNRHSMGAGKSNAHKVGIRGHQWKGNGVNRACVRCGKDSGSGYPGYTKEERKLRLVRSENLYNW